MKRLHLLRASALSLPLVLGSGQALAQAAGKKAPAPAAATKASQELVSLSFANAEIAEVARAMAAITGRSVVLDPRVKGTVNLNTDKPVSKQAAYDQFLAALRLQGFAVVETAGLYKVVPEAEAKLQGGAVTERVPTGPGNQIVTQVFRLNHESANNLVPVLRPLISPNNTINVNPGNNSLVVTDYSDNLQRVGRIIAALDVPNASDLDVIPLQHAIAADVAPLVTRLMESQAAGAPAAAGQADASYRTVVLAEPRANAVIVRAANPARAALARSLVQRLDQPGSNAQPHGNIHVVYLKNADATKLATTLRAALAASDSRGGATGGVATATPSPTPASNPATAPTGSSQPSTGGQIQADPSTNALIISAPEPQYRQLRAVIEQLDVRRAQVFVESLIVEVNADKAAEFGVQWQGLLGQKGDGVVGAAGTNFNTNGANNNIIALGAGAGRVVPGPGLNFGLFNRTNGVYTLGVLARFLQSSGDANVLSTPNLLTLDNEEAKIVIGQNVPFVTGQYSNNNAAGGSVNPFQTIERRDVGLTLRVKPQINENGTVKMQIFQEVSNVDKSTTANPSGLTTNKRSIESSVLVEDGAIVVLGGLLQDEYSNAQDRVPGLSDVPLLGNLFRSESRTRKKSNLMVFLRPVVVRDAQAANNLSIDRYDMMRNLQGQVQPVPSAPLVIEGAPQMPPLNTAPAAGLKPTPILQAPTAKP